MLAARSRSRQPCEYVTIVRDPLQRVISNYHHPCLGPERPSLEGLLASRASHEFDNYMTRCFCGKYGYHPAKPVDRRMYEIALANLNRFRFIGHQERSGAAWAEAQQLYGWNRGTLSHINQGVRRVELSASEHRLISEFNKYDLMLYREITGAKRARLQPASA